MASETGISRDILKELEEASRYRDLKVTTEIRISSFNNEKYPYLICCYTMEEAQKVLSLLSGDIKVEDLDRNG